MRRNIPQSNLSKRFDRWTFLQNLLDWEDFGDPDLMDEDDYDDFGIPLILIETDFILRQVLEEKRTNEPIVIDEDDVKDTGRVCITPEIRGTIGDLLIELERMELEEDDGRENVGGWIGMAMTSSKNKTKVGKDGMTSSSKSFLEYVERLLPDPDKDEDANKSCWDVVAELYGQDAMKHEESVQDIRWVIRCAICRLLIHYDFLTDDWVS